MLNFYYFVLLWNNIYKYEIINEPDNSLAGSIHLACDNPSILKLNSFHKLKIVYIFALSRTLHVVTPVLCSSSSPSSAML